MKELLISAAKAVNLQWVKQLESGTLFLEGGDGWNPLLDDSDAFRLAVKLNIDINFTETLVDCGIPIAKDNNPYAATRYAIVRAAARIGDKM